MWRSCAEQQSVWRSSEQSSLDSHLHSIPAGERKSTTSETPLYTQMKSSHISEFYFPGCTVTDNCSTSWNCRTQNFRTGQFCLATAFAQGLQLQLKDEWITSRAADLTALALRDNQLYTTQGEICAFLQTEVAMSGTTQWRVN